MVIARLDDDEVGLEHLHHTDHPGSRIRDDDVVTEHAEVCRKVDSQRRPAVDHENARLSIE